MSLTGNQRRYLRSLAHHLTPIVQVGHQGVTEGVVHQLWLNRAPHEDPENSLQIVATGACTPH